MCYCKVLFCKYPKNHTTQGHLCMRCKKYGHGEIECKNKVLVDKLQNISDILPSNIYCEMKECNNKEHHTTKSHHCENCYQNHSVKNCPLIVGIHNSNKEYYLLRCPLCRVADKINKKQKITFEIKEKCHSCLTNNLEVYFPSCGHSCLCLECTKKMDVVYANSTDIFYSEEQISEDIIKMVKTAFGNSNDKVYTVSYAGLGSLWYIRRDFVNGTLVGAFVHSDSQGQYGLETDNLSIAEHFVYGYRKIMTDIP